MSPSGKDFLAGICKCKAQRRTQHCLFLQRWVSGSSCACNMHGKGTNVQVWSSQSISVTQKSKSPFQECQELWLGSPKVQKSHTSWFSGRNQAPNYSDGSEPLPAKKLVPNSEPGLPNIHLRFKVSVPTS